MVPWSYPQWETLSKYTRNEDRVLGGGYGIRKWTPKRNSVKGRPVPFVQVRGGTDKLEREVKEGKSDVNSDEKRYYSMGTFGLQDER